MMYFSDHDEKCVEMLACAKSLTCIDRDRVRICYFLRISTESEKSFLNRGEQIDSVPRDE